MTFVANQTKYEKVDIIKRKVKRSFNYSIYWKPVNVQTLPLIPIVAVVVDFIYVVLISLYGSNTLFLACISGLLFSRC